MHTRSRTRPVDPIMFSRGVFFAIPIFHPLTDRGVGRGCCHLCNLRRNRSDNSPKKEGEAVSTSLQRPFLCGRKGSSSDTHTHSRTRTQRRVHTRGFGLFMFPCGQIRQHVFICFRQSPCSPLADRGVRSSCCDSRNLRRNERRQQPQERGRKQQAQVSKDLFFEGPLQQAKHAHTLVHALRRSHHVSTRPNSVACFWQSPFSPPWLTEVLEAAVATLAT